MRRLKIFTFFFLYPLLLVVCGFVFGVSFMRIFYPGSLHQAELYSYEEAEEPKNVIKTSEHSEELIVTGENQASEVVSISQKLNASTSFVLEENDLRNDTIVETSWKLPAQYIGMNKEQFIEAMELYEASPPLDQLERGFVSLSVLAFSPQKVVVQMNYNNPNGETGYYLMAQDNYVIVYLEDKLTVYMDTDICLKDLPDDMQQEIIQVMFMPDEASLYDFLENYSS